LLRGERGAVEVEGEFVRRDAGAFLRGVLADDLVQSPVQDVRDGVVTLDGVSARRIDDELHGGIDGRGFVAAEEVEPGVADFGGGGDGEGVRAEDDLTRVADLAAHFGVAGGDIEHDGGLVFHLDDFEHLHIGFEVVVTDELGRSLRFDLGDGDDLLVLLSSFTGHFFLALHELVEAIDIDLEAALACKELGEIKREALFIVKFESKLVSQFSDYIAVRLANQCP
jgi:hypothetical protein